uniref:Uncharacterized protein n=1 Tax=Candidatus Kentrum sp. DK TaxID=2126562 RepID=A0A450T684_9GAMM|nr:MAG: hypothetical protein BECKDK2373C_GA0170839_102832 [Candidatus Kentron sp. DK]VFJ62244.1 MAG: hypothetical protein BECKDK2373B_GA0170837_110813 [Candidatus Kentron sp. DK]
MNNIHEYLCSCRELATLCTQNGWIDNDTLAFDVVERDGKSLVATVLFEEIIVEAAGCIGGRRACQGRVRLSLDDEGGITGVEVL